MVIYLKNHPNQTCEYWLIKPNQQTLCIETNNDVKKISLGDVIIKVIMAITTTIVRIWIATSSFYRTLPSATWQGPCGFSLFSIYCYIYESLKP